MLLHVVLRVLVTVVAVGILEDRFLTVAVFVSLVECRLTLRRRRAALYRPADRTFQIPLDVIIIAHKFEVTRKYLR